MPIYAYRCASCGHAKDVLQKLSDAPLSVCPACGAAAFAKQVTAAGFQLKGSGWYATDFKGGNSTKKPDGDGNTDSASTDASKNDAGKTEAGKTDSSKTDSTKSDSSKTDSAKSGESVTPAKSGDTGSSSSPSTTPSA
jgi:putative FmdB family regulatory protein